MDCRAARLLCPWNSPGQNTGVGGHFLLQGIFPTQASNPGLLHCRQIFTIWATREFWIISLYKKYVINPFQFSSVAQSCPALCNPMDCSTPGLPVHHQLLELTQTYAHRVGDAIQPSHPLMSPSPPAFNLSQHQGLFKWVSPSHQVAKASASASVLPMNIQDWLSLGWTGWISCSKRDSQESSPVPQFKKHQFFGSQLSLQSNFHIHTWLLEKP